MQDLTNRTVMKKYLLLFLVGLGGACTSPDFSEQYSENEKNRIDSIVFAGRNIDTLRVMVDRFAAEENLYGQVVACRELGRSYRNASMFAEAVDIHKRGLCCAETVRRRHKRLLRSVKTGKVIKYVIFSLHIKYLRFNI